MRHDNFLLYDLITWKFVHILSWMQLPEPFSFIFTWFAAVPLLVWLALTLTNAVVRDSLILKVTTSLLPIFAILYLEWLPWNGMYEAILTVQNLLLGPLSKLWNWECLLLWHHTVNSKRWQDKPTQVHKVSMKLIKLQPLITSYL